MGTESSICILLFFKVVISAHFACSTGAFHTLTVNIHRSILIFSLLTVLWKHFGIIYVHRNILKPLNLRAKQKSMAQTIFGDVFEKSWKMKRLICGFMISPWAEYSRTMEKQHKELSRSLETHLRISIVQLIWMSFIWRKVRKSVRNWSANCGVSIRPWKLYFDVFDCHVFVSLSFNFPKRKCFV